LQRESSFNKTVESLVAAHNTDYITFCKWADRLVCHEGKCKSCDDVTEAGKLKDACDLDGNAGDELPVNRTEKQLNELLPPVKDILKTRGGTRAPVLQTCGIEENDWLTESSLNKWYQATHDELKKDKGLQSHCSLREYLHESQAVLENLMRNHKGNLEKEVGDHAAWYRKHLEAFNPEYIHYGMKNGTKFCRFGDGSKPEYVCGAESYCVECESALAEKDPKKMWPGLVKLCQAEGSERPKNEKPCEKEKDKLKSTTEQAVNETTVMPDLNPSSGVAKVGGMEMKKLLLTSVVSGVLLYWA